MNPEGLVAELATVQRIDALYQLVQAQKGVDVPRLSTGIAGVMSKKPADTIAALELLDHCGTRVGRRRSGSSASLRCRQHVCGRFSWLPTARSSSRCATP